MDTNYSKELKLVLDRSRREAMRLYNNVITPAHLLLAIMTDTHGKGAQIMEKVTDGISLYDLRTHLSESLVNKEHRRRDHCQRSCEPHNQTERP